MSDEREKTEKKTSKDMKMISISFFRILQTCFLFRRLPIAPLRKPLCQSAQTTIDNRKPDARFVFNSASVFSFIFFCFSLAHFRCLDALSHQGVRYVSYH